MNITYKKLKEIIPYARNNKIHSDKQIKKIAASIKEFGFKNPVIIDEENVIIAGHGRVLASEVLNIEDIPCMIADDLTEAQIKAYRIADNKLASLAEWDEEMLAIELQELGDNSFDFESIGFEDSEVEELIGVTDSGYEEDFRLPDGGREPFQQMTFTLSDHQAEEIKEKISKAKKQIDFDLMDCQGNENSNGNALYCLVMGFVDE